MSEKMYITTPIYYANAKPHIGSAYPTIAADVLARYYQQQGRDIFFLTGTAEHGQKIAKAASESNQAPQAFVDTTSQFFKDAWSALRVDYTRFIRTTEPAHVAAVTAFFEKLKASGDIYEDEYEGLYCVGHEAFVKEVDLDTEGYCPDHRTKPEVVKETNWFFRLSKYADALRELIESEQLKISPDTRRNEVLSFINQGLDDIAISRQNVDWAIPLPWDTSQTIYVWLDELFNYCSAIGYGADQSQFSKYWPADIHIVGKDIIKFHCVIWPALLLAINEAPPRHVFAHGFFTVNGDKISKSLGNAIDPVELAAEYGADAIRYYVLREIPFGSDGDFSPERLRQRYNADLANGLGNLVSRTLNMIEKYVPESHWAQDTPPAPSVRDELTVANQAITTLQFDKALTAIWRVLQQADEKIEQTRPWELAKANQLVEVEELLHELYSTLQAVNTALAPIMPETHAKLADLLAARPIKKPAEPLFARKD